MCDVRLERRHFFSAPPIALGAQFYKGRAALLFDTNRSIPPARRYWWRSNEVATTTGETQGPTSVRFDISSLVALIDPSPPTEQRESILSFRLGHLGSKESCVSAIDRLKLRHNFSGMNLNGALLHSELISNDLI
jgi:hypothetical protein